MTLIKDCTEIYMAKNYNLCFVAKLDEGTEELRVRLWYIYIYIKLCNLVGLHCRLLVVCVLLIHSCQSNLS